MIYSSALLKSFYYMNKESREIKEAEEVSLKKKFNLFSRLRQQRVLKQEKYRKRMGANKSDGCLTLRGSIKFPELLLKLTTQSIKSETFSTKITICQ